MCPGVKTLLIPHMFVINLIMKCLVVYVGLYINISLSSIVSLDKDVCLFFCLLSNVILLYKYTHIQRARRNIALT